MFSACTWESTKLDVKRLLSVIAVPPFVIFFFVAAALLSARHPGAGYDKTDFFLQYSDFF
jgi:hypothetical protein